MNRRSQRGFTLIELMMVVLVFGLILSFSIPSFHRLSYTYQLHGATENIAAQMRLAREKAIATGVTQPFRCTHGTGTGYATTPASGMGASWSLPRGITYVWCTGTDSLYVLQTDGRSDRSGLIVVQDPNGARDTVSIQLSGFVLTR
jgi:prepilin-type N-terminal cleavage/methylation domain-containing protein